ncbi:L10-interacting MYB domain-containing protein-like isoform X2 [Mercurialis annua]|nr:L10-interacting MYB domain-containing protein-like isoform X2 [Mercurialis annua]
MASRVTRSSQHIDVDSTQQPELQTRARWTTGLIEIFADLMVDQVRKGNRQNNITFSKKAWKIICDEFYQKTGLKWDKEQLKSRYSLMRKQHAVVKSLLSRTDFHLDEPTGNILATNAAWSHYIQEHPDAEPIRGGGCPIYKQLGLIFSEPLTNGHHVQSFEQDEELPPSVSFKDPMYYSEEEIPSSILFREHLGTIQEEESSSDFEGGDDVVDEQETFSAAHITATVMQTTTAAMDSTTAANRKRGRRGVDDAIGAAISHMAAVSRLRTAAIQRIIGKYSVADCIKELDAMQGVEEGIYFAALDLFNNRNAREIFLSLKCDKRRIWLRTKCTAKPTS